MRALQGTEAGDGCSARLWPTSGGLNRSNVMVTGVVLLLALTFLADIEVVIDFVETREFEEASDDIKEINFPLVMLALLLTTIIFVGIMIRIPGWVEEQNGRQ